MRRLSGLMDRYLLPLSIRFHIARSPQPPRRNRALRAHVCPCASHTSCRKLYAHTLSLRSMARCERSMFLPLVSSMARAHSTPLFPSLQANNSSQSCLTPLASRLVVSPHPSRLALPRASMHATRQTLVSIAPPFFVNAQILIASQGWTFSSRPISLSLSVG